MAHDVPLFLRMPGPPAHARAVGCCGRNADAAAVQSVPGVRIARHLSAGVALPVLDEPSGRDAPVHFRAGRGNHRTVAGDVRLFLQMSGAHGGVVTALAFAAITATVMGLPLMEGTATYYAEPYIGRDMRNQQEYTGRGMTCAVSAALWDELRGSKLFVCTVGNKDSHNSHSRCVMPIVTDTGNARAFRQHGVAVDLSVMAFRRLAGLDVGTLPVRVWRIGEGR